MTRTTALLILAVLTCHGEAPAAPPGAATAPGDARTAPPSPAPPSPIVGRVFGRPITERDVREALRRSREGTSVRAAAVLAAGRILAREEAARAGIARGPGEPADVHVDRFLAATFSPTTSCHGIDAAAVTETWHRLRKRFVHPDVFEVIDLQIVCCPKGEAPCRDEASARCFEAGAARIEQVRTAVQGARTEQELRAAAASAAQSVPELLVHDYAFAYDYTRPHHDQGGTWVVMDPAIVDVVRPAQAGTLTESVRTPYGYHALWVVEHRPPDDRGPDDPSARLEIFGELCTGLLQRAREHYLLDMARNARPELDLGAVDAITAD